MLDWPEGVCPGQAVSNIQLLPYPLVTSTPTIARDLGDTRRRRLNSSRATTPLDQPSLFAREVSPHRC